MNPLILIPFIIAIPYLIWIVLFGCTLIKKLIENDWQPKKGLLKAVAKWEGMTPEERMETSRRQIVEKVEEGEPTPEGKGGWVTSPSPAQELKDKNDKAFKEGLLHPLPPTETQTPGEVQTPAVNLRPNP